MSHPLVKWPLDSARIFSDCHLKLVKLLFDGFIVFSRIFGLIATPGLRVGLRTNGMIVERG